MHVLVHKFVDTKSTVEIKIRERAPISWISFSEEQNGKESQSKFNLFRLIYSNFDCCQIKERLNQAVKWGGGSVFLVVQSTV